jgi:hypothetical protein
VIPGITHANLELVASDFDAFIIATLRCDLRQCNPSDLREIVVLDLRDESSPNGLADRHSRAAWIL